MGDDQSLDTLDIESERREFCARGNVGALLETTVYQQASDCIEVELMARTGNTPGAAVMGKGRIFHAAHSPESKMKWPITP